MIGPRRFSCQHYARNTNSFTTIISNYRVWLPSHGSIFTSMWMIVLTAITIWLSYNALKSPLPVTIIPAARAFNGQSDIFLLTLQFFHIFISFMILLLVVVIFYVLRQFAIVSMKRKNIKTVNLSRQQNRRCSRPVYRRHSAPVTLHCLHATPLAQRSAPVNQDD